MKRDCFGICLDINVLQQNEQAIFTHVRGYTIEASTDDANSKDELFVKFASPQMSGLDVLEQMKLAKNLVWRAGYFCPAAH